MAGRLADALNRRPGRALAAGTLLLALCTTLALGTPDRLPVGPLQLDERPPPEPFIVRTAGELPTESRVHAVALDVIASQIRSDPDVERVRIERMRDGADLTVTLADVSDRDRRLAVNRIDAAIDPGPLRVIIAGQIRELDRAKARLGSELWRLELVALPLVALAAAGLLGLWVGLAALASAALAIAGCAAGMRLLGAPLDLSMIGLAAGAPAGAGIALELAGALRSSTGDRLTSAGVAVAAAGLAPLCLLATPLEQAPSLAVGCLLGGLFGLVGTALFAPLALARDGAHVPTTAPRTNAPPSSRPTRALALLPSAVVLAAAVTAALALLERPPTGALGSLAPASFTELAVVAAAAGAVLALLAGRAALTAAALLGLGSESVGVRDLPARGTVLSTLGLAAAGGVLVASELITGGDEPELQLFGAVLAGGVVADFLVARLPLLCLGRRARGAAGSGDG